MRLFRAIALIFVSVLFFQCQKEVSHIGGADPQIVTPEPIAARLQGTVLDENGVPAIGVSVKLGSQVVTTDARGYFRMASASLDKRSSVVTAEKAGYFKAYRTFAATSGTNQVVIKLIKKNLAGTVDAAAGGSVTLSNGAKITLPANGIVKASNSAAYSGTVNVYAAYIDPTAADISQTVPGSFMANDASGTRVALASYGMLAVELESNASERLQIKSGSVASLTTPIPSSLQASAPQTIALWSVNEQTGIWEEEGTATRQGGAYVGDVKHFSFWNCDVPMNAVVLTLTVHDSQGNPLPYTSVVVKVTANPASAGYGITDSLGQVSGFVPAGQALTMYLVDWCGNTFYTQNIGPFTQNTNLGTITLSAGINNIVTIKGKVVNCAGTAVTNGYAVIHMNWQTAYAATDANGDFSANFVNCGTTTSVSAYGVDQAGQQQSAVATSALATPVTNVGTLSACGTSSAQFINYTLDGTNYSLMGTNPSDSLQASSYSVNTELYTNVYGFHMTSTGTADAIGFTFVQPSGTGAPGTYPMKDLTVQGFSQIIPSNASSVTLTAFPTSIGQFYEGSFSAQFTSGGMHTLTGTFRIRK